MTQEIQTDRAGRAAEVSVVVGNAPVSYGAFEITVGRDPNVPDGLAVLDQVSAAGYAGIDLGPVGYLGAGEELASRLAERGLGLAGGYLELPFSEPARTDEARRELDSLLDVFDTVGGVPSPLKPKPTLADLGSDRRRANPGGAARDRSLGYDEAGWRGFAEGVERAAAQCRERGYEPTFHHETSTGIEAAWEIDRLLELTSVDLCLDTGHLLLVGGDPVRELRRWAPRINHVHLKDARTEVLEGIVRDRAPVIEIWRRRAFCALGEGNLDVEGFLGGLRDIAYTGWLLVEQDILPDPDAPPGRAATDQRANREFLRERGF
jgi:inosose dehydratase